MFAIGHRHISFRSRLRDRDFSDPVIQIESKVSCSDLLLPLIARRCSDDGLAPGGALGDAERRRALTRLAPTLLCGPFPPLCI